MDDTTRTSIILAAINSTPQVTEPLRNASGDVIATEQEVWQTRVAERAGAIAVMVGPRSPIGKIVDLISAAGDPSNDTAKIISGTVLGIDKERSSTRGLVKLKTKVHEKFAPDGTETARTERTDGAAGLAMAQRIRTELIGHRVLVFISMEEINGGSAKVRTIIHVEDLGLDETVQGA